VIFNPDPRLQFTQHDTNIHISDEFVRSMFLSAGVQDQLSSMEGLTSDLWLFDVSLDLTGSLLSPGAAFGAKTQSLTQAIPEPSTLSLLSLVSAMIWFARRNSVSSDHAALVHGEQSLPYSLNTGVGQRSMRC
jgi:hypothetical protein